MARDLRLGLIPDLLVLDDEQHRTSAGRDFGGLGHGNAHAVVRPATPEALVALVEWARGEGQALTPRGLGYSQSGQSVPVDGVSVEMSRFGGLDIAAEARTARCGAAVTWRELLARTAAHGLAPEVMPLNLDLSIGGTLSAGGTGSTSHRHGMAVSSVTRMGVVTGAGEHAIVSPSERKDVFDALLGGVGQFGFICWAEMRLRPMRPVTRTMYLLYDELPAMLADQCQLMADPWCIHLEGFASAAVQGLKRGSGGRRAPFARWFYGLHVSTEIDVPENEPPLDDRLRTLRHRELVHVEDAASVDHAARYDIRFDAMRATGAWNQSHPWLECMVSSAVAAEVLPDVIDRLPLFLGDGHRIMVVGDVPRPELLAMPDGAPTVAFAILPMGVPAVFESAALGALRDAHERLIAAGGKRYLSGWLFEPDEASWRAHFGDRFASWSARKQQLDPDHVLRSVLRP